MSNATVPEKRIAGDHKLSDISTKPAQLCQLFVCLLQLNRNHLTSATILLELLYLAMLIIFQLACTASSEYQLKDREHARISQFNLQQCTGGQFCLI